MDQVANDGRDGCLNGLTPREFASWSNRDHNQEQTLFMGEGTTGEGSAVVQTWLMGFFERRPLVRAGHLQVDYKSRFANILRLLLSHAD